jgi:predicted membrane channel-forming protein YqfA (hemolysin III family)
MKRATFVLGFTLVCVLIALLWPAMPQPLDYHRFVDTRGAFGIPNFGDVVSNVGFLIAGVVCLYVSLRKATVFEYGWERIAYVVFAIGMLLTALGSSYYHLAPDNERLVWDRLPMTIAFMSLIASQITERVHGRAGAWLLAPLLLVGAASVFYWRATERAGAGNVMPYGVLQGYSVVILLLLAAFYRSRYTRANDIYWVFAWYVIAKLLEQFDGFVFGLGHVVSGHTLKHLAAGVAGLVASRMLLRRGTVSAAPPVIPAKAETLDKTSLGEQRWN